MSEELQDPKSEAIHVTIDDDLWDVTLRLHVEKQGDVWHVWTYDLQSLKALHLRDLRNALNAIAYMCWKRENELLGRPNVPAKSDQGHLPW